MTDLKIEKPCPMLLARMSKDQNNTIFCKACKKNIVDFRDKSLDEILSSITKETCGIFNSNQLKGQSNMTFLRQLLFYGLMILSFFGCNVRPINISNKSNDTTLEKQKADLFKSPDTGSVITKEKEIQKKKKLFHKKKKRKNFVITGSPY
ncbi:MAG: hypothetical protein V4608_04915 [Bacteroidota bacterium]